MLCIGNTNNCVFDLAHAFTQFGWEVTQLLTQSGDLHDPKQRLKLKYFKDTKVTFVDFRYISEESQLSHPSDITNFLEKVRDEFDLAILDNIGPSFFAYINSPKICYISGSNLSYYGNPDLYKYRIQNWASDYLESSHGKHMIDIYKEFSQKQSTGIRNAELIISYPLGIVPAEDTLLKELDALDIPRFFHKPYTPDVYKLIRKLTESNYFRKMRVISAARIEDISLHPGDNERDDKGSDHFLKLIEGLHKNKWHGQLTIFKKGKSFGNFMKILSEKGLDNFVKVLPELNFNGYLREIASNNYVIDSLGKSPIGKVAIDASQLGKKVVTFNNYQSLSLIFDELKNDNSIFVKANSVDELVNFLLDTQNKKLRFRDEEYKLKEFISHNFSQTTQIEKILELLKLTK